MNISRLRRFVPWGAALTLALGSSLVLAQDGAPPTGPPVSRPRTNETAPTTNPNTTGPQTTAEVLPGIPATQRDPAPPGTRSVRVDGPPARPAAPASAATAAVRGAHARIFTAEGVVTRIDRAGKNVNGELERFAFDPSQDWDSYVNRGATGVAEKDEKRPKTNAQIQAANEKQHEDTPDRPKVLEMVITKRTYVYTYARTSDGTDQYGVTTLSSPDTTTSRTGVTRTANVTPATGPMPTNFTNIKEGSFVAVRYRKVGDLNEVLNLTLIELPMNSSQSVAPPASTTGTTAPARGTVPAGTAPAGTARPVRVPTVPLAPVGADLPR